MFQRPDIYLAIKKKSPETIKFLSLGREIVEEFIKRDAYILLAQISRLNSRSIDVKTKEKPRYIFVFIVYIESKVVWKPQSCSELFEALEKPQRLA